MTSSPHLRYASAFAPPVSFSETLCAKNKLTHQPSYCYQLPPMQEAPHTPAHYRTWLSQELLRRISLNPSYSLRRFAQQLGVSPSTLSGVLSGKRKLTLKASTKIVEKLGLSPREAQRFFNLVTSAHTGSVMNASAATPEFIRLSEEVFQVISEWYHHAILELTYVKGAKADPKWIAKKLGITHSESAQALTRLIDLGLIEIKNGRPIKTIAYLATQDGKSSVAIRKRHKQILQKAVASLEQHSVDERDFTAMTMSIDPTLLPEAKKRIAAFRRELSSFLESKKRKQVYELAIQLFPLSTSDEHEGKKNL